MEGRQRKHCHCGKLCRVQTSWTDSNPGRRFLVCPLGRNIGCCFFEWFDPEMCSCSKDIIPELRRIGKDWNKI
ncbi:hypothetical protein PRUPE_8G073400 [Prunus persica]|uniref:GRF-type domain-containing protein n=1 Tax=Prunus persica TaxID=3760 RepID=A0A251MXL8_PRUPE|nr:hypothetical protein PRUPE_8G073400 [Prunus persica]